jgi:O-antigen/teichoic acid export membrane protein
LNRPFADCLPSSASTSLSVTQAAASQWVGALISSAISVALIAWLARALQPQEFALFGASLNAGLIALAVMEGGWNSLLYRELASGSALPYAARLPAAALAHLVAALGPCVVVLVLLLPSSSTAVSAALCMFAVALMNQYSARLRAAGRFTCEALWQVAGRVFSATAIVSALLLFADDASTYLPPSALVFLAWLIGLGVCLSVAASQWWRAPSWAAARSMYPMALALLLTELSVTVIGKGDLILLAVLNPMFNYVATTRDALPGYAASVRLVEGVLLLTAPFANVVISYLRAATGDRFALALRRVLHSAFALWFLGWFLWGLGWASGQMIIRFAFGSNYVEGASWLAWAALPLPWMMANLVLLQAAIAMVSLKLLMASVVFCAASFLVTSIILLALIGATGVGVGAALAQAMLSFLLVKHIVGSRHGPAR